MPILQILPILIVEDGQDAYSTVEDRQDAYSTIEDGQDAHPTIEDRQDAYSTIEDRQDAYPTTLARAPSHHLAIPPMSKRIRAIIHGTVQGVGFRYYTQQEAVRIGVTGCVRNLPDGTVELVAEGTEEQLQALLSWAHQGPAAARVTRVEVTEPAATGEFESFSIER
jgi:acylphosphatase